MYTLDSFRRLYPEYNGVSEKELSKKLYAQAGRPLPVFHPWIKLMQAVFIGVGIPLTVLLLGCFLTWALAGFRVAKEPGGVR